MKCSDFREQISMYIDGMLDEASHKGFMEHMNECPGCRRELEEMQRMVTLCGSIPEEEIPENFTQELHKKLVAEKERQEHKNRLGILRRRYMKAGSVIAAGLLLVFMMKGLVTDFMPLGGGKTSDLSSGYSADGVYEAAASPEGAPASDPRNDSLKAGNYKGNDTEEQAADNQGTASLYTVIDSLSGDTAAAATAANAGNGETSKAAQYRDEKSIPGGYSESTRGELSSDTGVQTEPAPEIAMISGVVADDVKVTVRFNEALDADAKRVPRLCNISSITIKVANPRAEIEKIRAYLAAYGANIMEDSSIAIPCSDSEQNSRIQQNRANGGTELIAQIPVPLYEQFSNALKSSFSPAMLAISPVRSVDMAERAAELENELSKIDIQITNILKDVSNSNKDLLEMIRKQKERTSSELLKINQGMSNIYVIISLVRN